MNRYENLYCCPNKKEADILNKQKEKAKEILGTNYAVVYRFFRNVLELEYCYKIFRSRRCQVLFNIFAPIILNDLAQENPDIWEKDKGIFISDNSLAKYKEKIVKGDISVLLVDDIMIHGRGLKQLYETIDPDYKLDNIKIYVMAKNHEDCEVNTGILDRLEVELPVFEWGWKELSSQLVNLIYNNATPYISYVGSYYEALSAEKFDWKDKLWELVQQKQINWVDNTNEAQKKMKETSGVFFEKRALPVFFDNLCYACCLRLYENSDLRKRTLVPYVFLKNFSMAEAETVSSFLAEKLDDTRFSCICKSLRKKNYRDGLEKELNLAYKMRLANALVSLFYGIYVADCYGLSYPNWEFDIVQFGICYGKDIAEEVGKLVFADFSDFINITVLNEEHLSDFQEDDELSSLFDPIMNQIDNQTDLSVLNEKMEKYFFENGIIDEQRAKKVMSRKEGITINKILGHFSASSLKNKLISALLNAWDSGIASGSALALEEKDIVAMYVAAGEQCFRYGIKSNKKAIVYILQKYQEIFFKDKEKVKKEIFAYIDDEYSKNPEGKDELYSLIGPNLEKLGNLNIPDLLN